MTVKISVLIPIYNAEKFLFQALESLHQQIWEQIEFICLNDGSTDDSLAIVQGFLEKDDRFKLINKDNSGYGSSMNLGIEKAQGDYVAIFEPDDYIEGQMYADLYRLAEVQDYPDVVKSAYWSIDDSAGTVERFRCGYWKRIKHEKTTFIIKEEPLLTRYHPSIWSAIYRRDFLQENNIHFKEIPGAGWVDNPFMMETLLKARSIAYTDNAYYCYRDAHEGSSTANISDMHMPVDRWLEMAEIMRKNSSATSGELWSIHAYKAFLYLEFAKQAKNYDAEEWQTLAGRVLGTLDPSVVAGSEYLSDKEKHAYEEITGRELPAWNNRAYTFMLMKEAYWKVRQNGIGFMLKRAKQHA